MDHHFNKIYRDLSQPMQQQTTTPMCTAVYQHTRSHAQMHAGAAAAAAGVSINSCNLTAKHACIQQALQAALPAAATALHQY
jgi:hypothetical protein